MPETVPFDQDKDLAIPKGSHLHRFVELYRSFGITCCVLYTGERYEIVLTDVNDRYLGEVYAETYSDKFEGYGMYTRITFDADGRFIKQGFWE